MTPVSLYYLARRKSESGDRFEIRERQSFLLPYLSQHIRSVRYHTATQVGGSTQARHKVNCPKGQEKVPWGITVSRNPFARCNARHLRIMRSIPFIFADAVCNNALTHCAALSCRTLRRVARMCSSMVSDTANMRIHGAQSASRREEKSSAVPLFRSGHRSPICARLSNKGKAGVQRGRKTAGCPSFLPPRRAPRILALRRAQLPPLGFSEHPPPVRGEHV